MYIMYLSSCVQEYNNKKYFAYKISLGDQKPCNLSFMFNVHERIIKLSNVPLSFLCRKRFKGKLERI